MKLYEVIKPRSHISPREKEEMYLLFLSHYDNVQKEKFLRDLEEKEGVLLLYDQYDGIKGFSTYLSFIILFKKQKIRIIFSGDTIVDRNCWGSLSPLRVLAMLFSKFLKRNEINGVIDDNDRYKEINNNGRDCGIDGDEGDIPCYWFLISKGVRTYLLLPVFFKRFYPCGNEKTPEYEKKLMDYLGDLRFGGFYHKEEGIIRMEPPVDRLKAEFCPPGGIKWDKKGERGTISGEGMGRGWGKNKNPHAEFFYSTNPGYLFGDELLCIALIHKNNLTSMGIKLLPDSDFKNTD